MPSPEQSSCPPLPAVIGESRLARHNKTICHTSNTARVFPPALPDRPRNQCAIPTSTVSAVQSNKFVSATVRRSPRKQARPHTTLATRSPTSSFQHSAPNVEQPERTEDFCSPLDLDIFRGIQFNEADKVTRLHSFLFRRTVKQLHDVNRPWKLRMKERTKLELIARILAHIFLQNAKGKALSELISGNEGLKGYDDWEKTAIENLYTWEVCPNLVTIIKHIYVDERKTVARSLLRLLRQEKQKNLEEKDINAKQQLFTINEFARLAVLIRDDQRCRYALHRASGSELKRNELDANVTRESFWKIIEDRFNDKGVSSKQDFSAYLESVNSDERPSTRREAAALKTHYTQARTLFTKVLNKWSASGQNDPGRIIEFVAYKRDQGGYTMESKRTLVLFVVYRLGTMNPETDLVQASAKLIEVDGDGRADSSYNDGEDVVEVRKSKTRKRKSSDLHQSLADDISKKFDRVESIMQPSVDLQRAQSDTEFRKLSRSEREKQLFDDVLDSVEKCKKARESNDEEVQRMGELLLERKKQAFRRFMESGAEGVPSYVIVVLEMLSRNAPGGGGNDHLP